MNKPDNSAQNLIMSEVMPLLRENRPVIIAIDGRCASGKTSAANVLADLYGNAVIIHMDDFFLPPELRSEERYEQPGGNIHYERFLEEVAENLRGKTKAAFNYKIFDCGKMSYNGIAEIKIQPDSLVIIEGAYCLRPEFCDLYDLKIFMNISPENQEQRIKTRDGENKYEMFAKKWIPLEERYISMLDVIRRCDLVIENY